MNKIIKISERVLIYIAYSPVLNNREYMCISNKATDTRTIFLGLYFLGHHGLYCVINDLNYNLAD